MFINLSNHPSTQWSESQIEVATRMGGQLIDMPFPVVDPEGDKVYIAQLAGEYLAKILELSDESSSITVHLMGEMTFTFALANLLYANNITCVASTTERQTKVLGNGQKESVFSFVQFRDYY